jgi:hypothetical protein
MGILLLGAGLALWGMTPSPAAAQCGDYPPKSSCITCHEKENPVYEKGKWHGIHALKDCCTNCHGGNCMAIDKDLAHEGLVMHPLEDIYTNCYHCHPDDYQVRAGRFSAILGGTPSSNPTPTAVPVGSVVEHPIVILPPSVPNAPSSFPWPLALGGLAFTALFLLGLSTLYTHPRSRMNR